MKLRCRLTSSIVPTMAALLAFSASNAMAASLSNSEDKLSYTIGADIGSNFKEQNIAVNPDSFLMGLEDGLNGKKLQLTDAEMKSVLQSFQKEMMEKRMAEFKKAAEVNQKAGAAFLAENKKKPGVVTLPDGLQYKVITAGKGVKPTKTDSVTVEYKGMLPNGQVFDSTEKAGKPITFKVNQVIPGWTEALEHMPAGSTWEVVIPASLAYGAKGVGGPIGPNQVLVFNIHLISVNKNAK